MRWHLPSLPGLVFGKIKFVTCLENGRFPRLKHYVTHAGSANAKAALYFVMMRRHMSYSYCNNAKVVSSLVMITYFI